MQRGDGMNDNEMNELLVRIGRLYVERERAIELIQRQDEEIKNLRDATRNGHVDDGDGVTVERLR